MNLTPVISCNLAAVGYEQGTLYVRFNDGSLYAYRGVPESEYHNLMSAASHGKYLAAHIKGHYAYQRIG